MNLAQCVVVRMARHVAQVDSKDATFTLSGHLAQLNSLLGLSPENFAFCVTISFKLLTTAQ